MQVCLLGGVAAVDDGGNPIDVGPAKCRAVLAALALSVGEAVSVSRLIDVVWGEDPPRTAEKTLQGYVARLRKGLGLDVIVRSGAAYRLELAADHVDVSQFRRALSAGDVEAALGVWSGQPLVGLDVPGLRPAVDGLVQQWLEATEHDLARRVAEDAGGTIGALTELAASHPLREELWALLMTALYRTGRQADALAVFQTAREHLVEELGIEPGPRLRILETQILAHADELAGDHDVLQVDAGHHPPLQGASRGGNLPLRLGRLFGRDEELDIIAAAMESSPVVTLVGPGGIGKTALALAAARRSETTEHRRVWFLELAEIAHPDDVVRVAAETLGVAGGAGRTLTESVVAVLRSRPTLLVLDNCEHVIDAAAALARAVADAAPDTRVLATSREGLDIPGERRIGVPALHPAGSAVELFTERAAAASATFDLAAVRADVEEICSRLDGLPLAIELAAARTTSLTPQQLLARLDRRLGLLRGSRRTTADRHRTLRATVQWSYDLLSPEQQGLFEKLAVFVGPFDLLAAEAVAGDGDAVGTDVLVGDLVERSMVAVEAGPFGRRFRLLETLREFASERLADRGIREEVSLQHARWCATRTARIGGLLAGSGEIDGVAQLAELWPNLRAAVDWAGRCGDVDLADALVRPMVVEVDIRRQGEIGDWAELILDLTPGDDEARKAFWLLWAGHRHAQASDHHAVAALLDRHGYGDHPVVRFNAAYLAESGEDSLVVSQAAIAWLREHGEHHAANLIEVSGVASSLMTMQRFPELAVMAADMSQRHREEGPPTLRYFWLGMQGYAAQYQGLIQEAECFFLEAEATELPAGTYRVIQTATARMAFSRGDRHDACQILRDNIDAVLDSDYTDVARMIAVEFITMVGAIDRLPDAAAVLTYLDTTGDYGRLAREHLVADVVRQIAADPASHAAGGGRLDAHEALLRMRGVLDDILSEGSTRSAF